MSEKERKSEVESRFNLHPGSVYRVRIQNTVYDGILTELEVHINHTGPNKGFLPIGITLEDGLFYQAGAAEKFPFDKKEFENQELECLGTPAGVFGRVLDEDGFRRRRKKEVE